MPHSRHLPLPTASQRLLHPCLAAYRHLFPPPVTASRTRVDRPRWRPTLNSCTHHRVSLFLLSLCPPISWYRWATKSCDRLSIIVCRRPLLLQRPQIPHRPNTVRLLFLPPTKPQVPDSRPSRARNALVRLSKHGTNKWASETSLKNHSSCRGNPITIR
jgi:hypothetical protein